MTATYRNLNATIEACRVAVNLLDGDLEYITDLARGEYRGFAALHDRCDANMLLPLSDDPPMIPDPHNSADEIMDPTYVAFCNALMAEFNRIVLAGK